MFYGRENELQTLEKRYSSDRFEFGFIFGERRIGKTSLLDYFQKGKKSIMLFASDSDDMDIRSDFSSSFFSQSGQTSRASFSDWSSFFLELASYFGDGPGLVVIDEYPNIVLTRDGKRKKTDFVSKLQNAIDHEFKKTKIVFILTGSNVSFMEKEVGNTASPLYRRNTFQLLLSKLEWDDALCFLKGMPLVEKAKTLALTNTFPYYLSLIDPKASFEQNLDSLFYSMDAVFTDDPSKLITSDLATGGFYASLLLALSKGIDTVKGLQVSLGAESGKIAKYLLELQNAGIVSKKTVFLSSRLTSYSISDPMLSFFYRFIRSNAELIKLGNGMAIKSSQISAIENFLDHAFEQECLTYLESMNKKGRLPYFFKEFQNYKVENSSLGRSVEIDIVSMDEEKHLLVGECKFSKQERKVSDYLSMKEDVSIPPFDHASSIDFYLFGSSGFSKELEAMADPHLHLIDLPTMIKG